MQHEPVSPWSFCSRMTEKRGALPPFSGRLHGYKELANNANPRDLLTRARLRTINMTLTVLAKTLIVILLAIRMSRFAAANCPLFWVKISPQAWTLRGHDS